jgi:hypothetical protein
MEALYILIPLSVALVFLAVWIFLRATDTGRWGSFVTPTYESAVHRPAQALRRTYRGSSAGVCIAAQALRRTYRGSSAGACIAAYVSRFIGRRMHCGVRVAVHQPAYALRRT